MNNENLQEHLDRLNSYARSLRKLTTPLARNKHPADWSMSDEQWTDIIISLTERYCRSVGRDVDECEVYECLVSAAKSVRLEELFNHVMRLIDENE